MADLPARLRRHGPELLVGLCAAEGVAEILAREDDFALAPPLAIAAVAALILPLMARRRWPFAAPAALWIIAGALSFLDGELVTTSAAVFAAGMVAAFLLGHLADARQGRYGLILTVVSAGISVINAPQPTPSMVLVPGVFALAWLAGAALRARATEAELSRQRAEIAELERVSATRVAVAEERARIARELHDIVAHSVSVMVLQSGVVRRRIAGERPEDADLLGTVETTGRTALREMRALLGALRCDEPAERSPQPGLGRLDALLDELRLAGLPVVLRLDGEPVALPDGIDLSAYRIVQEGLTNALKHAPGAQRVEVRLRYDAAELGIDVRDDGAGPADAAGGHGLIGIRERVMLYGGEMSAGRGADGGFELRTRLPIVTNDR